MPEAVEIRGTIVTPYGLMPRGRVAVDGNKIKQVGKEDFQAPGPVLDFCDCLVAPGFIDLHVHGGLGYDVMDASGEALNRISEFLAAGGVTSFLATTRTSPKSQLFDVIDAVKHTSMKGTRGSSLLGLNVEGPYINPTRRGAQDSAHIRPPDMEELKEIHERAGRALKVVSVAPELEGALEAVSWLCSVGVVAAAGHTDATYEEMIAGVEAGVRHVAHLFNGMRPFHHREPGAAGAALVDDRLSVELIADGVHIHPAALRLAASLKGVGKTALVSDSISPAGLGDGEYEVGGEKIIVKNGGCLLRSGILGGSTIRLCDAVKNMVELAGFPVEGAVEMAASTPARIIGVDSVKGRLAPGMDADLTVFDREFSVLLTMVGGRVVYEGGERVERL